MSWVSSARALSRKASLKVGHGRAAATAPPSSSANGAARRRSRACRAAARRWVAACSDGHRAAQARERRRPSPRAADGSAGRGRPGRGLVQEAGEADRQARSARARRASKLSADGSPCTGLAFQIEHGVDLTRAQLIGHEPANRERGWRTVAFEPSSGSAGRFTPGSTPAGSTAGWPSARRCRWSARRPRRRRWRAAVAPRRSGPRSRAPSSLARQSSPRLAPA